MNLIYIDPLNKSDSHLYFNKLYIYSDIRDKFVNSNLLVSEIEHGLKLTTLVPELRVILVKSNNTQIRILKSIFYLLKNIKHSNQITFLSIDNTLTPLLIIFFHFLFKNKIIKIILHNNIDTLLSNSFKRYLHKIMLKLINAEIIVLTNKMKYEYENRLRYTPVLYRHFNYSSILKNNYTTSIAFRKNNATNISVVGRHAKIFKEKIFRLNINEYKNLQFSLFGCNSTETFTNVNFFPERLNENDYYGVISNSDYIFFADDPLSINRASGVLMDCITLRTKIIAPDYGHYHEYKKFNIGLFYDTNCESRSTVGDVLKSINDRQQILPDFEKALLYSNIN